NGYYSVNGGAYQNFGLSVSQTIADTTSVSFYGRDIYGNQSKIQTNHYIVHPGSFVQFDGSVSIEAEHPSAITAGTSSYAGRSWSVVNDAFGQASAGKYLEMPDGTQSANAASAPRVDFEIDFIDAGEWYVWVRMKGPDDAGNSIHLGLDGNLLTGTVGLSGTTSWSWVNSVSGAPFKITVTEARKALLNLWMREDGAQVDKIYLTRSASDIPSGSGVAETPRKNLGSDSTPPQILFSTAKTVFSGNLPLALTVNEGDGFYSWTAGGPFTRIENDADGSALNVTASGNLYTFSRDRFGNASPVVRRDYVRDDASPILVISRDSQSFDNGAQVQLSLNEAGTVLISEDGGATWKSFAAPYTYSVTHNASLLVYGLDEAGNASPVESRLYHTLHQSDYDAAYVANASGKYSIEAEHYTFATRGGTLNHPEWKMHTVAGASGIAVQAGPNLGDSCTSLSSLNLAPRMDYPVKVGPGTWYVWVRFAGTNSSDDSIHVGVNGGLLNAVLGTSGATTSGGGAFYWKENQSSARMQFTIPPGTPVGISNLNIWMREDGVSVDKIHITPDPNEAAPAGEGAAECSREQGAPSQGMAAMMSVQAADTRAPILSGALPSQSFNTTLSMTLSVDEPSGYYQLNGGSWVRFDSQAFITLNTTATLRYYALDAAGNTTETSERTYTRTSPEGFGPTQTLYHTTSGEPVVFRLGNQAGESVRATLTVYDSTMRTIFRKDAATSSPEIFWDMRNSSGQIIPAGTYIYQLDKTAPSGNLSRQGGLAFVP
ncbi:MAG: hypothetical protein JNM63_18075, partial [Spirochaetia bacterium]|nr:hypothetical protein [Spirochaetia bacterium]